MDGKLRKISPLAVSIAMAASTAALAGDEKFDMVAPGTLPADWICGVTGKGSPVWKVESDASAPTKPNVLKQSGTGTFPWCVKQSAQITDGFVEVKFKPLAGREDQAGGLIWRFKDTNNYYIARMNPLEDNFRVYKVVAGKRSPEFQNAEVKIPVGEWHILSVKMVGDRIECSLDGKKYLEAKDDAFTKAGKVGLWTKADAQTSFDNFTVKELK